MEKWKNIPGFGGKFMISNKGRVVKIMGGSIGSAGYRVFQFIHNQKVKTLYLHRILMQVFSSNPKSKPCVNHKDGDKLNNKLSNLEWSSYSENNQHAWDTGLRVFTDKDRERLRKANTGRKMPEKVAKALANGTAKRGRPLLQFDMDGNFIRRWSKPMEAARELNIENSSLYRCLNGELKSTANYKWKYE